MSVLRTLRKLVLGETWRLPAGVALALVAAAGLRAGLGADGVWRSWGGVVLGVLLLAALAWSLAPAMSPHVPQRAAKQL